MSVIELEICNICKRAVPIESIFQIFDSTCTRFLEEIKEISGVNFNGVFEQPWYICMECYTDLLTAQGFRGNCIKSYTQQTQGREWKNNCYENEIPVEATDQTETILYDKVEMIIENEVRLHAETPCKEQDTSTESSADSEKKIEAINNVKNICEVCGEIFPTNRYFSQHLRRHKTDKNDCKQAVSHTKKNQQNSNVSKICEICGNVFETKRNFALHLRRHTNNKRFDCEICSKKFHTNAELKCHMRRHTGEKPYECRHCHRRFSDYGTNKKHERTHTNDRPFTCNFCEKAFTSAFILKNHVLTHTGKRGFKCKICVKSFVHLSHLTSHLKSLFHQRNCKRLELDAEEEEHDGEEEEMINDS